jgi:RNA polymerase sigma-70 factor (ECF subfamily)
VTTPAENPPDQALIAAVLAGDRDRFQALVERYEAPLKRLAKNRLGRFDWAEDVVQETFLWAYKSLASYDSRYSFRTWLWTILLNQCNRHFQRRTRQAALEVESRSAQSPANNNEPLLSTEVSPADTLIAKERSQQLATVLAALPEVQADALRLRFFGDLKFQEIADVQGCSLSSAKNRVRWGLLKMAECLEKELPTVPVAEFVEESL